MRSVTKKLGVAGLRGASTFATAAILSATAAAQVCPFDNGGSSLENDGLVLTRYALGLRGAPMVANTAFAATDAPTIESNIACPSCGLRVTDDVDALNNPIFTVADATIISRKIAGFQGASLTNGLALGVGTRNTPAAVQSFLLAGCGAGSNAWVQGGNAFGAPGVMGTTDGQPLTVQSGGSDINVVTTTGDGLRLSAVAETDYRTANVINGSSINSISAGVVGATIAGGGQDTIAAGTDYPNRVLVQYGTVGGGSGNTSFQYAVVSGGHGNSANGSYSNVSGGSANTASGHISSVGGGSANTASGQFSAVAGGFGNIASGSYSAVVGGSSNTASGANSFAVGHNARANTDNCAIFGLWSTTQVFSCSWDHTLRIGADRGLLLDFNSQDGIGNGTNYIQFGNFVAGRIINTQVGAHLTFGGVWTNSSDRALKENLKPINAKSVLQKVLALPVTTWNYLSEGKQTQRMGPMAQDFYSAFRLGSDDKTIGTVDASGVALAAIQGLNQKLTEQIKAKDVEIAKLTAKYDADIAAIKKKLGM
ncbi:MAG: tail fiber domain-containing protein [Casimicrobium sp.]